MSQSILFIVFQVRKKRVVRIPERGVKLGRSRPILGSGGMYMNPGWISLSSFMLSEHDTRHPYRRPQPHGNADRVLNPT
jgi:hypothetical protein